MRAIAVLMMIEGHTVDTLLAEQYRTFDSLVFTMWSTIRGFTAPIFMFTSGAVFTYLLHLKNKPFAENPRVKKGLKRFLLLLGIGYLLRYPTWRIFDFSFVGEAQWRIFFGVDALHLIGFGLLFIIVLSYAGEKLRVNFFAVYAAGALFFILLYPFVKTVEWTNILPLPLASYMYKGSGSLFPLFPWTGYMFSGAILGEFLARKKDMHLSLNFGRGLILLGIFMITGSLIMKSGSNTVWTYSVILSRLGGVILLNGALSLAALKLKSIPVFIRQIGTHTLLIYAVHLVILYGSAWSIGMAYYWGKSFGIWESIFAAAALIILMSGLVFVVVRIDFGRVKIKISENYRRILALKKT